MKNGLCYSLICCSLILVSCKEVDTKLYPLTQEGVAHHTEIQDAFQRPDEGWHYAHVDTVSSELMVKYEADVVEINEVESFLLENNWLKRIQPDTVSIDSLSADSTFEVIEDATELENEPQLPKKKPAKPIKEAALVKDSVLTPQKNSTTSE